ncbi:MAG: metal ABC transporter permease [Myxococcaceae bacterium]|nr:metal ABC transporter permease [Myxococcaceae bacterium]
MNDVSLPLFWTLFWPAISAAVVAALLSGLLGFFVVTRRVAFVSAALGQLSGLAVASGFLLGSFFGVDPHERTPVFLDPVVLALVISAIVAAALAYVSRVQRTTPESTVAFVYLAASALALIVLANPRIVQEAHEVGDLLFGNTVAVRPEHLVELGVVAGVVAISVLVLFKDLVFLSFDREMARTLGLPVTKLDLWLHLCIGVSVAVATRAIGALPVFGFLVLPTGAALLVSDSTKKVVALSMAGAVIAALLGFYLSFQSGIPDPSLPETEQALWSLPTGPMMVVCAAAYWPVAAAWRFIANLRARR